MPDHLSLSCWLEAAAARDPRSAFGTLLGLFPFSRLTRQPSTFRVLAVDRTTPTLFECSYPAPVSPEAIRDAAADFGGPDLAYELETWWDLWQPSGEEGSVAPARVTLAVLGPEFDSEAGEHLRIDFGPEAQFLPDSGGAPALAMVRSNVRSLLKLAHDVSAALPCARRSLSGESGASFAARLEAALAGKSQGRVARSATKPPEAPDRD
jgi:hypothetical protein